MVFYDNISQSQPGGTPFPSRKYIQLMKYLNDFNNDWNASFKTTIFTSSSKTKSETSHATNCHKTLLIDLNSVVQPVFTR